MISKISLPALIVLLLAISACAAKANPSSPPLTATPPQPMPSTAFSWTQTPTPSAPGIQPQFTIQNVIASGTVRDGPFIFDLRLFRDSTLNQQPVATSLYSDLNGIGAYMLWSYQGSETIGPVETYWGTLPSLDQLRSESFPSISQGASGGRTGGILLPGGFFLPGKSEAGDRVLVVLEVVTPIGNYGGVIVFTLFQGNHGYEPTDINFEVMPPNS